MHSCHVRCRCAPSHLIRNSFVLVVPGRCTFPHCPSPFCPFPYCPSPYCPSLICILLQLNPEALPMLVLPAGISSLKSSSSSVVPYTVFQASKICIIWQLTVILILVRSDPNELLHVFFLNAARYLCQIIIAIAQIHPKHTHRHKHNTRIHYIRIHVYTRIRSADMESNKSTSVYECMKNRWTYHNVVLMGFG